MTADYLSVLTARRPHGAVTTKRLFRATNGAIGKSDYDSAYLFDVDLPDVDDLADVADVLETLIGRVNCLIIRGRPIGSHRNVLRRLADRQGGAFAPDSHHWLMVDFDQVRLPIFLEPDDDPELLLGFLVRRLPVEFHDASFCWQWSCGHGIDHRYLRAHLWFWSREKHTDAEFENWAKWVNAAAEEKLIDPAVFRAVQPHYICAPLIADDVSDPVIGDRYGVHVGSVADVAITMPTQRWEQHVRDVERELYEAMVDYGLRAPYQPTVSDGETYLDHLLLIGDDHDGFHEPITRAIWYWAKSQPPERDATFKQALRQVVRDAVCTQPRDLDAYLTDQRLDASLRGAREKIIPQLGLHKPFLIRS